MSKKIVQYTVILEDGVRKRHYHVRKSGKVISFAVQLEVLVKNQWKPILRYDNAHGFSHIDQYCRNGRSKKISLELGFESALILADWDINNNWEIYVKDFKGEVTNESI